MSASPAISVPTTTHEPKTATLQERAYNVSPIHLKTYDRERHIPVSVAHTLLSQQQLDPARLQRAIEERKIRTYDFHRGESLVDRLDIGRVYYQPRTQYRGLTIERYFSQGVDDPLEAAGPYETRDLKITDKEGKIIFRMEDAKFPASWDDTSAKIVAQKYLYKPNGEEPKQKLREKIGREYENSPAHLVRRVSSFFADWGKRLGYFETEEDAENFRKELEALQIQRKFAFNSPVQFNAGIYNSYGIGGGSGFNYWRNPETGEVITIGDGCNVNPQCHACFIKGPQDNLESILEHVIDEGGIFHSGSGIGQNIGALREQNAPLSGGGKSSGPLSFLKIYDVAAGSIKSGGKSRRAARMTTMRSEHPDVLDFIDSKVREDKKMLLLMKHGYAGGMDGEAATTVALQNTNISVRMTAEDFEKVKNGGSIELKSVVDGRVVKKVPAEEMLRRIAYGAWRIGDPAVQYETKIQEMHTCPNSGRQNSTNPCSEYLFLDNTSCNLASLNVLAFCDEKGNLDVQEFMKAARIITIAQDIANDTASYPVKDIATISPEFRTIGLGYANIGAWLMRRGLAYDSDEGRAVVGALTAILTGTAYTTSAEMAEHLGPFMHYELNKRPMLEVMEKHKRGLEDILWKHVPREMEGAARGAWDTVLERGQRSGFRNAQATVIAPTGTIAFLMGCDTTGIEPALALWIFKDLAGGGTEKLVNKEVSNALRNRGYKPKQIEEIVQFVQEHNTVRGAPYVTPNHYTIFDTALGNDEGIGSIPFEAHVRMLAAAQPFVSGAISKTNNLPETATVKDLYDGFMLGHELGLKALAAFRKNGKPTSAVNFGSTTIREVKRGEKEDLPARRGAYETEVKINGTSIHILVSEYADGRPGQIAFLSYRAGSTLGALLTTSGIQASRALKRGVELEDIIEGWIGHEFEPRGLVQGHPHIKTALSPLDFAGKFLKLEYLGDTSVANNPASVDVTKLHGFKNGAFRTYARRKVDDWDYDQVMKDPEFGGFVKEESKSPTMIPPRKDVENNNPRGLPCNACGRIMVQTAPGCFKCLVCGDNVGGCGI
ncbi:vitamin B12-dependent ribonucleotide reductase [Candidatus Woesearchaeota archaeon]|nr:vitamin B12-dependent ribonucleotide reductase [Candidatus Woesearchaeota archaeon]